jgi:hypothetical protein
MNTTLRLILTALLSCLGVHANAGLFSLEIVEPATGAGDIGTLQILYHGEEENLSFAVGGLDLKLSSSTAGVIKFLDAEVINDDGRWDVALARDISDNEISDLFTASLFTPGLAPGGPQVFAEVKYSLVGAGHTELLLDVGGEDPLYQGDRGDVASYVRSRGLCIGDCDPTVTPTEINLGDTWAVLKEQLYTPSVPSNPQQPTPATPTPTDPVIDVPPIAYEPQPIDPADPEPVNDPPVDIPVDLTNGLTTEIEIEIDPEWFNFGNFRWVYYGSTIDVINFPHLETTGLEIVYLSTDPNVWQLSSIATTNFAASNVLQLNQLRTQLLASTMAFDSLAGLGSTIPEPHSFALAALASLGLLYRHRR